MSRFLLMSLLWARIASAQAPSGSLLDREFAWADYYARQYGVPAELVAAVIDVESAWQPAVVSGKGAAGLMQLMPATAYRFGVTNRFQIEENIRGGVAYLAYLMRQFGGDSRLAAAAYYAGEMPVRKLGLGCADANVYRYVKAVERSYKLRQTILSTSASSSNQGEKLKP
jgi:soluble lytic murein transglycosylase-like protein